MSKTRRRSKSILARRESGGSADMRSGANGLTDRRGQGSVGRGALGDVRASNTSAGSPTVDMRLLEAYHELKQGKHQRVNDLATELVTDHPTNADAWHLMGLALHCQGEHRAALRALEQAIQCNQHPNATVHSTHGSILSALGRHHEAIASYEMALVAQPRLVDAWANMARSQMALRDYETAEQTYRKALRIDDQHALCWSNLGVTLFHRGNLPAAEEALRKGLALTPNDVSTLINLSNVLLEDSRTTEAIAVLHRAVSINARSAPTLHNLGHALIAHGHIAEAVACYRAAKAIDPNFTSSYLFGLSHSPQESEEFVSREHLAWGAALEAEIPVSPILVDRDRHSRLRIGYVSADFRRHVMVAYMQPVFRHHDRTQFEVYAYSNVKSPDATTASLRESVDHWRDIGFCSDEQVVEQIRRDEIDILVDLSGHTGGHRLGVFAHKPAPVQVTWLGYSNTTGLSRIDYRIANSYQDPPESAIRHSERLFYAQGEGVCWEPPCDAPAVAELPAQRHGYVTFGSLHRLNKLSDTTLDAWCRVLQAVPNSRLRIFWPTLTAERQAPLREFFASRGIADHRIDMVSTPGPDGYLGEYHEIDIGLDVWQWTGSTTTREALWMGVVVLAHAGSRRSARGSATVLHYLGLSDCIANSTEEYVDRAVALAGDLPRLAELRRSLRWRFEKQLGNPRQQLVAIEDGLQQMWRQACELTGHGVTGLNP